MTRLALSYAFLVAAIAVLSVGALLFFSGIE